MTAIISLPSDVGNADLPKGSIAVTEGSQPKSVEVNRLPTSDIAVVLVIDTSASMKGAPMAAARAAATTFVDTMPASTPVAIVGFGDTPIVLSGFSIEREITRVAISKLRARGNTTLYDAVLKGAQMHAERVGGSTSRRVMVVLTDGGDTRSRSSLSDVTTQLNESGIAVTAVAMTTQESDVAALSLIASSAKGSVVSASDPARLQEVFRSLADSVLNQYAVSWTSTGAGSTSVSVTLQVGDKRYRSTQILDLPQVATSVPVVVEPLPAITTVIETPSNGRVFLLAGLAGAFAAFLAVSGLLLWPRPPRRRLAKEMGRESVRDLTGFSQRLVGAARRLLRGRTLEGRLQSFLERAGVAIDPARALVVTSAAGFCALLLGLSVGSLFLAVLFAAVAVAVPFMIVRGKARKRCELFKEQFESTLQIMTNSLKAGYGISQAVDTVARESASPTSDEFRRVVRETRLGMDQIVALEGCADRVNSEDLHWVTDAIAVNREVGGNLTELFAGVAETLRSRNRLARQVVALSAEGRVSAKILIALPLVVILALSVLNRSYLREFASGVGPLLLAIGAVLMMVGYAWTRRIIKVDY